MIDKSLYLGQQTFLFCDIIETLPNYDYVLSVNRNGTILIARYLKDGTEGRYCIQNGNYLNTIYDLEKFEYTLPNFLNDPKVLMEQ